MADNSNTRNFRKLLSEIIDTEKTYVKNLEVLSSRYLDPLSTVTFLTTLEITQLSESLREILKVQRSFLKRLERVIEEHSKVFSSEREDLVRNTVLAVGDVFLFSADQFKIYSSFCALYSRVQDILNSGENEPLRHFLESKNETKEHCNSLESFIIQPIQRILKYPLFLRQMAGLTLEKSEEHRHICKACDVMQCVANHINEMQKLSAEFGESFRSLSAQDLGVRDLWAERPDRQHSADNIPVIKAGYCVKEGGKMKSWKRRYFVLNEYGLFYFTSEERRKTTFRNARESIFYTSAGSMEHYKSGYCTKQGGKWKNWLSRYFVVNQDGIMYFTSEQSIEALGVIPKNSVNGVQEISPSQFDRDNVFEIHTCCRTYYLQCENHDDLCEWVSAIRRLLPHPKIQLNVGELCTYSAVHWCNIRDIVGKKAHACEIATSVFVFRSALAIISRYKQNTKEDRDGATGSTGSSGPQVADLFRSIIPADDILVTEETDDMQDRYTWSVTQSYLDDLPPRTYKFCTSSKEIRSRFVTAIQDINQRRT
uniref:Protein still life, isoform SIF type 1 n=1 Tax=Magallana gigas TaxID=29159 RepID=K1PMS6_MAGGI